MITQKIKIYLFYLLFHEFILEIITKNHYYLIAIFYKIILGM